MRRLTISAALLVLCASPLFAQSMDGAPKPGEYGAERRWMADHPEAVRAIGEMPREDAAKLLDTYKNLPPAEQQKLRDHAGELQALGPQERKWALDNPDAVRQLGDLSDADRKKVLDTYQNLSPAEQAKLREHAGDLETLSPEERQWALDHTDTLRQLGNLPEDQVEQMFDAYRSLPPETQKALRDGMTGGH